LEDPYEEYIASELEKQAKEEALLNDNSDDSDEDELEENYDEFEDYHDDEEDKDDSDDGRLLSTTLSLEELIMFEVYDRQRYGDVKVDSITPTFNITGMTLDSMNLTLSY
jgi:hypothetical protein